MIGEKQIMGRDSDKSHVTYSHSDTASDKYYSFSGSYDFGTTWMELLEDYINFLSGIYGYDIREKVEFVDHWEFNDKINQKYNSMFDE